MTPTGGTVAAEEVDGLFVEVDVTDEQAVGNLFATAHSTWGSVDIAFNNAGISPPDDDSILETGVDAWRRVQEVNLTSVYLCCKSVIPYMHRAAEGLDHQHCVLRRGDGRGDVADLLHARRRAGCCR